MLVRIAFTVGLLGVAACELTRTAAPNSTTTKPTTAPSGLTIHVGVGEPNLPPLRPGGPTLHVVFRNGSATPVSLMDEWNSFGYFNMTLAYTLPDGTRGTMAKDNNMMWTMNAPTVTVLQPGQCLVRDVYLDPDVWSGVPKVSEDTVVTVVATFKEDQQPGQVWQGTIRSDPVQVTLHAGHQ